VKLIVYVDGSDASVLAIDRAIELAEKDGAEVTALHVAPPRLDRELVSQFEVESGDLDARFAEEVLGQARERFESHEVAAKLEFIQGEVAVVICRYAEEGGYERILIGGRDTGGGRLFDLSGIVKRKSSIPVEVIN
jgi:nucleotide-binding universal stress UspA family protein